MNLSSTTDKAYWRRFRWLAVFGLLAIQLLLAVTPTEAAVTGQEQPAPATLKNAAFDGRLDPESRVEGAVVSLKLRDPQGAENFVAEVYNPASPLYHQFLTPSQFMQLFGPQETTVNQVVAYFKNQGFEVERDGLLLSLSGKARTFEDAFKVELNNYLTKVNGEMQPFFSADRLPLVSDALKAYVQSIQLHSRPLQRASVIAGSGLAQVNTPPKGLNPDQIRKAYNAQPLLDANSRGQGQTLALVQLTTYSQGDIANYAQQFGISGYQLQDIVVNGNRLDSSGAGEASLDIEISIAVAPQLTVLVYQAGNSLGGLEQIYSKIINDNRAPITSSSWGQCELYFNPGELDTLHSILTQGSAQGLQFFSASGDSGAFDCNDRNNQYPQLSVDYPASDPNVIGVGGTSLQLDGNNNYAGESVWANAADKTRAATGAGSGGGISALWPSQPWQNAPGTDNQYSKGKGKRQVPDVSANADPATGYAIYCTVPPECSPTRPWLRVGGTSASAPLWAASALLVNQYNNRNVINLTKLYELASQPQQFPSYREVASGNNLYYPATPGYDLASGLGTPDFFNIARNLGVEAVPTGPVLGPNPAGFADSAFAQVWNRTDKLVADGVTSRTWLWGQKALTSVTEPYAEAPGGQRQVQYFDKSRMEINNPNGDRNNQYFVTNGLLAKELITGQIQVGNNSFQQRSPANIGIAGDPDDKVGPTYANLSKYLNTAPNALGVVIFATINRNGDLGQNPYFGQYNVSAATLIKETNHTVAKPFWDYLNSQGPVFTTDGRITNGALFNPTFYATGLPISEPYWTQVKVAGQVKDVLVQAFERRVLTYTPSNAPAWRVEMGNVGQHYYKWRYGQVS
jgi:kumamolisin